jgi:Calcium binding
MGWYYSLEDRLHFPFVARCIAKRSISPLRVGDEVEVVGMAPEEECQHEMFVLIRWERRGLGVPLAQLEGVAVDEQPDPSASVAVTRPGRGPSSQ